MNRSTIALTTAGLLTLAAAALKPDLGTHAGERYAHVAAHPGAEQLSACLFLISGAVFVLAGIFVFADRPTGRGARAVEAGAVLTALTGIWQAASLAAFGLWFAQSVDADLPRSGVLPLLDNEIAGQHLFDLFLLCELLGPAVIAVGLWRAGRGHWALAVLWLVGIVGYGATEFISTPGQVVALAVATAALFLIGRAVDRVPTAAAVPQPV